MTTGQNRPLTLSPAFQRSLLSMVILAAMPISDVAAEDYFDPDTVEQPGGQRSNLDLSSFNHNGGQAAGVYNADVYLNENFVGTKNIRFEPGANGLQPQLMKADFVRWGVKDNATTDFMKIAPAQTVTNIASAIPQARTSFDLSQQRLNVSIPQEYVRQNAQGYVAPEEWDDGVNALFLSYGYSGANNWSDYGQGSTNNTYLNLRSGLNLGAWRLRNYTTYSHSQGRDKWNSINTYVQRDIKPWKSQLVLGESYTPSEVFDSFAFRGAQLYSDDNMQPESLRGFAPVVRGIAQSNAQVTIRQDGNIIWQSYVPPGPFSINDLYPTSASGDLEVVIKEANGSIRQFVQPFSAVPIMQREGRFKYAFTAGQYRSTGGSAKKPGFLQGTGIYGLPYSSTIYGGSILSGDYTSASIGMGKGLGTLGSISLDGTFANTRVMEETYRGGSFRFQYAKDVAMSGTTFTLAGYRYSTSGYYDFNEANGYYANTLPPGFRGDPNNRDEVEQARRDWQSWRYSHNKRSKSQLNVNQSLGDYGSLFLSAYQQQYWGVSEKERSLTVGYNTSFNAINYSLNYSYSQTPFYTSADQVFSLAVQIPFERFVPKSWLNFSASTDNHDKTTSALGLSGTALADNNLSYSVQQGYTNQGSGANGNASVNYKARFGEYQAGYNYTRNTRQLNYGATGGIVVHPYGVTLSQSLGDTMALVRAEDAGEVRVLNQTGVLTDSRGYAVVPNVTPYRRTSLSLDANSLGDNVDLLSDSQTIVPTQSALALAHYPTVSGSKIFVSLRGREVPFGARAEVINGEAISQGIVDDRQRVYLSGAPATGVIKVNWKGGECQAPFTLEKATVGVNSVTAQCR
ncbi:fimbria/pilus outer membrane usher protein [Pantoea sp. DY-5]|uniref:fimbria/pilus outer membrane usher protein n=1 Tax=Pantoea sp. DY-5 TaxID=2871488 RepID=UPI001C93AFB6|nr:fimbria/pilus outer membrane usher protein [Pantoea sp. DY-5]MBY4839048.1 fimbrial biogenesis outer membrane usher protein [Pantoea sp. DY-5]